MRGPWDLLVLELTLALVEFIHICRQGINRGFKKQMFIMNLSKGEKAFSGSQPFKPPSPLHYEANVLWNTYWKVLY